MTSLHTVARLDRRAWGLAGAALAIAWALAGCGSRPTQPSGGITAPASQAATPRAYRQDGARHLYSRNADRIYAGRLPPLLYAVGTLEVDLDGSGRVTRLNWLRAPRHAPEVIAEIERTVRAAQPFPQPVRMGKVTYTDTWLWDKSGRFQLDTLTEGQIGQE